MTVVNLHYYGLTYSERSKEAERLIRRAADTGYWFELPEALAQLRDLMRADPQYKSDAVA